MLGDHQQRQQRRSSASAASVAMTRKSSSSLLHLPVITKPAGSQKTAGTSSKAALK
jgi:hypothetical protein